MSILGQRVFTAVYVRGRAGAILGLYTNGDTFSSGKEGEMGRSELEQKLELTLA